MVMGATWGMGRTQDAPIDVKVAHDRKMARHTLDETVEDASLEPLTSSLQSARPTKCVNPSWAKDYDRIPVNSRNCPLLARALRPIKPRSPHLNGEVERSQRPIRDLSRPPFRPSALPPPRALPATPHLRPQASLSGIA